MRAWFLVLFAALGALWLWFAAGIAPRDATAPVAVAARAGDGLDAAELNNEGVRLFRAGREADALAYFRRAHDFHPADAVYARNAARVEARVLRRGWLRMLVGGTVLAVALAVAAALWSVQRTARDRLRLRRLRLRGDPWLRVTPGTDEAELDLRFSEPVDGLLRRHPLQIVWSCARRNKHMKSRPPAKAHGKRCTVRLDRDRLDRLRRHPGDWRGFLYLGKTPVGETLARVG